jgi:hypothetical protein
MAPVPERQWYPDPTGRHELRYWDGQEWTHHVSDNGIQGMDSLNSRTPPQFAASPGMGWGTPERPPAYDPYRPAYGYPAASGPAMEHPRGTAVLVLGIIGLAIPCSFCGLIGLIMGTAARREMRERSDVRWTNRGNITAGWICGIIGTCLLAAYIVFFIAVAASGGFSD